MKKKVTGNIRKKCIEALIAKLGFDPSRIASDSMDETKKMLRSMGIERGNLSISALMTDNDVKGLLYAAGVMLKLSSIIETADAVTSSSKDVAEDVTKMIDDAMELFINLMAGYAIDRGIVTLTREEQELIDGD